MKTTKDTYKLPHAAIVKLERLKQGDTLSLRDYIIRIDSTIAKMMKQAKKAKTPWAKNMVAYWHWVSNECHTALEEYLISYQWSK